MRLRPPRKKGMMDHRGPDHPPEADAESSLVEHLLELRTRLIRGLAGVALVLVFAMPFAKRIFEHLARPLLSQLPVDQAAKMIAADPTSGFFAPI